MQFVGRLNQCWVLMSYAARQITSLNYHKIRRTPTSTSEEQDICMAVYWCYYLDRTLSALFGRPPSLPGLQVSPSDLIPLDPSSLYGTMIRVILDLAQIQGELHEISNCGNRESKSAILETCRDLEARMSNILPILQTVSDVTCWCLFYMANINIGRIYIVIALPQRSGAIGMLPTSASTRYSSKSYGRV